MVVWAFVGWVKHRHGHALLRVRYLSFAGARD